MLLALAALLLGAIAGLALGGPPTQRLHEIGIAAVVALVLVVLVWLRSPPALF